MEPIFFSKPADFRKWLKKHHAKEKELLVGFYKVGSGKPSITWSESVDEALCFGWIDGVRRSLGDESYTIRFTPRKVGSNWSAINIKKIAELKKKGLLERAGLAIFEKREEKKSKVYTYENKEVKLSTSFLKQFKANKKAWAFFTTQAPSYQKVAAAWVMGAKQEKTKLSRLATLIADSAGGTRLKQYLYGTKQNKKPDTVKS
jgi:uncharacterized protein YdeI (YjbR/CyaY-like superfamily)